MARQRRRRKVIKMINEYYTLLCKEIESNARGRTSVKFYEGLKRAKRRLAPPTTRGTTRTTSIPEEIDRRVEYYSNLYTERKGIDDEFIIATSSHTRPTTRNKVSTGTVIGPDGKVIQGAQTEPMDVQTGSPGLASETIANETMGKQKRTIIVDVDWSPPDKEEWIAAIRRQRNRKAAAVR